MAGVRGILAALAIGSAVVALPAGAQSRGSASLTHTVSVTVPARVKVRVASLGASTPAPASVSSSQAKPNGLSLTVSASQAWVLAIGSASSVAMPKSDLQWSPDGRSQFSTVTTRDVPVAKGETVVLTVSAP